jgi:hypothetical protein
MNRSKLIVACVLGTILVVGWVSLGMAGEQRQAPIPQHTGQIQSIKIDPCALQPRMCEGAVALKLPGSQAVT